MPNGFACRHAHHDARSPRLLPCPHLILVAPAIAFAVIAGRHHALAISLLGPILGDGSRHAAGNHAGNHAGTPGVAPVIPVALPTPVVVVMVVAISERGRSGQ
jgi:hypothetical protein